jgi:cytochrome c oxidase cbb3-type subunit 4
MDINELRGAITAVTFATFVGICWWAYRSGNRDRFEQDARIPFLDDSPPTRESGADESEVGR